MAQDDRSRLRHAIRGNLNALKLGLSALELGLSREETLEFLEYLGQAAEKLAEQMGEYNDLPEVLPEEPEVSTRGWATSSDRSAAMPTAAVGPVA